jgi:large subunit ribosomal protein L19
MEMKTSIKISPVDISARQKIDIRAGDTVKVWQKIQEKGKIRLQVFEGLVLAVKHGKEPGATFTIRRVSSGVGVEKIFPLYSPMIDKIEVVKRSKIRRAKLYHIRRKAAKEIKRQMRNSSLVGENTDDLAETKEEIMKEEAVPAEEVVEKTEQKEQIEELK